jgi:hypothetical protein
LDALLSLRAMPKPPRAYDAGMEEETTQFSPGLTMPHDLHFHECPNVELAASLSFGGGAKTTSFAKPNFIFTTQHPL